MSAPTHVTAGFFLQVEPEWSHDGQYVTGAKAVRITARAPGRPVSGAVVVYLRVRLETSAFFPLQPPVVDVPLPTPTQLAITATQEER